jgi:hypothetical protein
MTTINLPDINPRNEIASIRLDAFNVMPGATFFVDADPDSILWVAVHVNRPTDAPHEERVLIDARSLLTDENGYGVSRFVNLDYNDIVHLVGLVVNPDQASWDDNCGNASVER